MMPNEQLSKATLASLDTSIKELATSDKTLMLLERASTTWLLPEDHKAGLLHLKLFDPDWTFDKWENGRIFDSNFELRWEWINGTYQTTYCGKPLPLTNFEDILDIQNAVHDTRSYFLWGTKVQEKRLKLIDYPPGSIVFAELQVARLFEYPVSSQAQRVKLNIREYHDDNDNLIYYRFHSLVECDMYGKPLANEQEEKDESI